MKVDFNQTIQINSTYNSKTKTSGRISKPSSVCGTASVCEAKKDQFKNVSFGISPDELFLISQTGKLKCFYTRKDLIDSRYIKTIYGKLSKRPNAQSAVNYLQNYVKNMFDVEYKIFTDFKEAEYKGKRGFSDILESMVPASLENIKQKQIEILDDTDEHLDGYTQAITKQVLSLRDKAVNAVVDGTFQRSNFLEQLLKIIPKSQDKFTLPEIYRFWSKLPSALYDKDAFVLKYHTADHEAIAKRLISPSVGTIEHVIPQSRGGENELGNYALAAAKMNNPRSSLYEKAFIDLPPQIDIKGNIQKYIDDVVREINRGDSEYVERSYYPEKLQEKIIIETGGDFVPEVKPIFISKSQKKQNNFTNRLSARFNVIRK